MIKKSFNRVRVLAVMLLMAHTVHAQKGASILNEYSGNINYHSLNDLQRMNYDIIASNPNVKEIKLVELKDLSSVQENGKVILDLPFLTCRNLAFYAKSVSYTDDKAYEWYGEVRRENEEDSLCSTGFLTLVHYAHKGGLMGTISLNGFDAEIQDLGDGIKVVAILDNGRLSGLTCGYEGPGNAEERPTGPTGDDCLNKEVKVLVMYTPAAKNAITYSIMGGLIQSNMWLDATRSIFETNYIYSNSNIGRKVVLAGVEELPGYTEVGNITDEMDQFSFNGIAQSRKAYYKADAAVLMTKGSYVNSAGKKAFGNSKEIGSYNKLTGVLDMNWAYAFVNVNDNHPLYTFSHELSHLLGARHDDDNRTIPAYLEPSAHGYKFEKWWGPFLTGSYRTAVTNPVSIWDPFASHAEKNRKLIPYIANPGIQYDGKATGTWDKNNALKVKNHYPLVGSFYTETIPFMNSIGVSYINYPTPPQGMQNICKYYIRLNAQVNDCGVGPFYHTWSVSYDGIYWYDEGSGTIKDIYVSGTGTVFIKLNTMSLGGSGTALASQNISYNCKGNVPVTPFSSTTSMSTAQEPVIYPNPTNGSFTLQYYNGTEEPVEIILFDITGRKLEALYKGRGTKGINYLNLKTQSGTSSGTYIMEIKSSSIQERMKLIIK